MAGSRLANIGTIFTRTTGLLKSGGLKETPLWYDVYRLLPPELEPRAERPLPPQDPVPEIVYEEDFDRALSSGNKYRVKKNKTEDRSRKKLEPNLSFMRSITELDQSN